MDKGKVLLLHTNAVKERRDMWEVPGGRIDDDENIEQTLRRELEEELPNIKDIKIHEILDSYRVPRDIDDEISLVLVFYKVTAQFEGQPQISDEHVEAKWFDKKEALEIINDSCRKAVRLALD